MATSNSTTWQVVIDGRNSEGRTVYCHPLAPRRRRRAEADGDLRRMRELYPAARLVRVEDEPVGTPA